jgi:hypothetical protein
MGGFFLSTSIITDLISFAPRKRAFDAVGLLFCSTRQTVLNHCDCQSQDFDAVKKTGKPATAERAGSHPMSARPTAE